MGKQKLFRVQAMNEKGMMLDVEVMGHKAHDTAMQEALGMSTTVKDALTLAAILAALALGLRLDLAIDPCAANIDARPVTCPQ